ncbi:MAG: hypothetical protein HYU74_03990 [Dechloromonas sp.]|nr:hypothetical protein [Dechloromonas sp.]
MSYLDADPTKPTDEILNNVRVAAVQSHIPGLPLLPFATLLVRLSQEASAAADKNLLIQKRMIVITVIVLAISIAQLVLAFLQFQSSGFNEAQRIVSAPQPVYTETDQKSVVPNKKPTQPVQAPVVKWHVF